MNVIGMDWRDALLILAIGFVAGSLAVIQVCRRCPNGRDDE